MEQDYPFVSRLKLLRPTAATVDPIAAAFVAGRQSAKGPARFWRGASVLCLVLCGVLWVTLGHRAERVPATVAPVLARNFNEPMPVLSEESEFRLERAVLEHGVDGLGPGHSMTIERVDVPGSL